MPRGPQRLVPANPPVWWVQALVALACLAAGVAVRMLAAPVLGDRVPFITFFPAVLAASIWGGWLAGAFVLGITPVLVGYVLGPVMASYRLDFGSLAAFLIAGGMMVVVGALLADALRGEVRAQAQRRNAEAELRNLVSELGHRAKNGLTMVTAIAEQSARRATSIEDYRQRLIARFQAMSYSQDVITQAAGPARLSDLLGRVLDPFDLDRFEITGPAAALEFNQGTSLGLALIFHELATNAVKYGALSAPDGRVRIVCGEPAAVAEANWIEVGGPAVSAPNETGFGARLIGLTLRNEGGGAEVDYHPDGVRCRVRFPTAAALPAPSGGG